MPHGRSNLDGHPDMTSVQSNEEFFDAMRQQIERWCDQRRLRELAELLPGYTTFFGLTDDWARLYEALKATRGHRAREV